MRSVGFSDVVTVETDCAHSVVYGRHPRELMFKVLDTKLSHYREYVFPSM